VELNCEDRTGQHPLGWGEIRNADETFMDFTEYKNPSDSKVFPRIIGSSKGHEQFIVLGRAMLDPLELWLWLREAHQKRVQVVGYKPEYRDHDPKEVWSEVSTAEEILQLAETFEILQYDPDGGHQNWYNSEYSEFDRVVKSSTRRLNLIWTKMDRLQATERLDPVEPQPEIAFEKFDYVIKIQNALRLAKSWCEKRLKAMTRPKRKPKPRKNADRDEKFAKLSETKTAEEVAAWWNRKNPEKPVKAETVRTAISRLRLRHS
jgi:hypothetical protein